MSDGADFYQILHGKDQSMLDDVIVNKAAVIERSVSRAREEYFSSPDTFADSFTRQDAAILNIQRACEAALDMGQHIIRRDRLGIPQSSRDIFHVLFVAGRIDANLSSALGRMVGFRNIAVHDYQTLHLPVTVSVINDHLHELVDFSSAMLRYDAQNI